MDWNPDPKILLAIEHSVAASRWRTAARFEGRDTAARFRRQAEARTRAATLALASFAGTVGYQPDRPHSALKPTGGAE
jgi:hypothetical protein